MVNDELLDFFSQVQRGIKRFGLAKVMTHLRKMDLERNNPNQKKVFEYVVVVTANHYDIPKADILYSNKRGVVTTAKKMCFSLLKSNIDVSEGDIGRYFDKSRQVINHAIKNTPIIGSSFNNKQEQIFVTDFQTLNKMVIRFTNELD